MFENPRRGRQARNFTTNAPKILDLKSSSEQIFSRKLPLGAPVECAYLTNSHNFASQKHFNKKEFSLKRMSWSKFTATWVLLLQNKTSPNAKKPILGIADDLNKLLLVVKSC